MNDGESAHVKISLERAALEHVTDCTAPFAEAAACATLTRCIAHEAARSFDEPVEQPLQDSRSPSLWAAIGTLAGAELGWAFSRAFGA